MPTQDEVLRKIENVLTSGKGSLANICLAYLAIIGEAEENDRPIVMRYLAEHFDPSESSDQLVLEDVISTNEEKELDRRYGKVVTEILGSLIHQNLPEDSFYDELWMAINSPIFKGQEGKAIALKTALEDKRIPYFCIPDDGRKMSNEEFKRLRKDLYLKEAKIRFLLSYNFSQKTEQADLILRELTSVGDAEKIVLMAALLKEARSNTLELALLSKLAGASS